MFLQQEPAVREVIAEVIEDNIASCKAFARAGYVRSSQAANARDGAAVYSFKRPESES